MIKRRLSDKTFGFRHLVAALLLVSAPVFAACGSDDDGERELLRQRAVGLLQRQWVHQFSQSEFESAVLQERLLSLQSDTLTWGDKYQEQWLADHYAQQHADRFVCQYFSGCVVVPDESDFTRGTISFQSLDETGTPYTETIRYESLTSSTVVLTMSDAELPVLFVAKNGAE